MGLINKIPQIDGDLGWFLTSPNKNKIIGQRLKGQQRADITIIGGGFTGLSTAERLKQLYPHKTIAIVEALDIGQGSSGRNAGFIIDLPHNVDANENTLEQDEQIHKLNSFAIERLKNWHDDFEIDCSWQQAGKYMVAHEEKNISGLDSFESVLKKRGYAYERLNHQQLGQRLGSNYYLEGIYTPGNILMNPAALVRGIAIGLQNHIEIYTHSPVIEIKYGSHGQDSEIHTVGGVLKTQCIVQCTSSFTESLGSIKNKIAPVFTYASLTKPLPQNYINQYFKEIEPWGLTSAHPAGTTVRFTPDHRILIRNILEFNPKQHSTYQARQRAWQQHRQSFLARFPFLDAVDFEYTWGGLLSVTMNYHSIFHKLSENVYIISGCNGVGVAKGTYLGYYMAEMIYGNHSQELSFIQKTSQPTLVPPEPFRSLGANYRIKREQKAAGNDI